MKNQYSENNRGKRNQFYIYVEGIVTLYRNAAYQQKRQKRCYKIITNDYDKAKNCAEHEIAVNERHNVAHTSCDNESRTDETLNNHKGFGAKKAADFFYRGVLFHFFA